MIRYKPRGWYNDSYRHSLSAKGIATSKRYAFVNNAAKGFRSEGVKVLNPKTGKLVDARHRASALGIETFNKRRDLEEPSYQEAPYVDNPMMEPGQMSSPGTQLFQESDLVPMTEQLAPLPVSGEQQAQQVEGGSPYGVSAPLPIQSEAIETPEIDYGVDHTGFINNPLLATPAVPPEPVALDDNREEYQYE